MSDVLPVVYLARHGEMAWIVCRQHTGRTDPPLTPQGEADATRLGQRLQGLTFAAVLTSPLRRAVRTSELAGFGSIAARRVPGHRYRPEPRSVLVLLAGPEPAPTGRMPHGELPRELTR